MKILLLDDDRLSIRLSKAVLEREGHEVLAFEKWDEAPDVLFRGSEFDLALLDVMMPGIHGDQIVEILKQTRRGRAIPVFLLSNLAEEILKEKAQLAGADGWISKPLTARAVRELVAKSATLRS